MNRNEFLEALPLSRITCKLTGATLELCTDDIDDIHLMVSGADGDVKALRIAVSGNQLLVEQPALTMQKNPISTSWLQITVRLPQTWKGRIDARTISGWITARGLSTSDLTLDSVSGQIMADALLAGEATMRTVTGDVRATGLVCSSASFATTSGTITVAGSRLDHAALSSIAGSMALSLDDAFQSITANSVLGSLSIDVPMDACQVMHRSVAGHISAQGVSITEDAGATVHFSTVSGSLSITNTLPTA